MQNIRRDKSYFKLINPFDNFSTREANRDSQTQKLSRQHSQLTCSQQPTTTSSPESH